MPLRFITTLVVSSLGLLTWGATYVGAQAKQSVVEGPTSGSRSWTFALPQQGQPMTIYEPGNGVTNPIPLHQEPPSYPADATASSQQGEVWMRVVVLANGTVGDVKVVKPLDQAALDAEAVRAAKLWLFKPAMRNSQPVSVYTTGDPHVPASRRRRRAGAAGVCRRVPDHDRGSGRAAGPHERRGEI